MSESAENRNQAEIFALGLRELGVEDEFGHAKNAVERRTNFVAHCWPGKVLFAAAGRLRLRVLAVAQQLASFQLTVCENCPLAEMMISADVPEGSRHGLQRPSFTHLQAAIRSNPLVPHHVLLFSSQSRR